MKRGVFITGTDTGVGKTLAACALIHALAGRGVAVAPMKPIAAGARLVDGRWLNEDTIALMSAAGWPPTRAADVTPVLLREPLAPHIAALREKRTIELDAVIAAYERLRKTQGFAVVEGVGGFCVPLGERHDTVDLARAMGLPVVLVVGMRLGCLSHALLTALAIERARLPLAGWIANLLDPAMDGVDENVEALRSRLAGPLLGRLPHLAGGGEPRALAKFLAIESLLAPPARGL